MLYSKAVKKANKIKNRLLSAKDEDTLSSLITEGTDLVKEIFSFTPLTWESYEQEMVSPPFASMMEAGLNKAKFFNGE